MKKYAVFILFLFTLITVKANDITLDLVCQNNEIMVNEKLSCELIVDSNIEISSIDFNYDSDISLTFFENDNTLNQEDNSISIAFKDSLKAPKAYHLLKIEGKANQVMNSHIILQNIRINDTISIDNIIKEIMVKEINCNTNISDITIDGVSLNGFNPSVNRYEDIITHKPLVFIDTKGRDNNASITGVGASFLREGIKTEINIRVTCPNSVPNIYTIVATYIKEDEKVKEASLKNRDATIKSLELYDGDKKLDFSFNNEKTSFRIKIDSSISKILVKATLNNDKSSFIDEYAPGEYDINYGDNIIELRTRSENDDTLIYTINVTKDDDRSGDNTLALLSINGKVIDLEKNKFDYDVVLDNNISKTKVLAKAANNKAKVVYNDINLYEDNNILTIKVIAENKKEREYRIRIVREEKLLGDKTELVSSNIKKESIIENILIDGYHLPFQKDVHEYDLNIDKDVDKLSFTLSPDDIDAEILNNENLVDNSTIIIRVKANNELSYIIHIHKDDRNDSNYIIWYIIFGLCVIVIPVLAFILTRKK